MKKINKTKKPARVKKQVKAENVTLISIVETIRYISVFALIGWIIYLLAV